MAYEQKPGDIVIFRNAKATGNQPPYRGTLKGLNGEEFEIALWVKEGKNGKFFAGKVKLEEDRPQQQNTPAPIDDDVPF